MSWIKDVSFELIKLDVSKKSLRKFGLTIGIILIFISFWFFYKNIFDLTRIIFLVLGLFLITSGIIFPPSLLRIYKVWMGIAFALGWFVSRLLLTILFLTVLTPIGLLAKLFKKEFLKLSFDKNKSTYWIKKGSETINYEKMY